MPIENIDSRMFAFCGMNYCGVAENQKLYKRKEQIRYMNINDVLTDPSKLVQIELKNAGFY